MKHTQNTPHDLKQLLELAAHGDTLAFEDLYTETAAHVYPLVRAVLQNSAESIQSVLDIYVRIWACLTDYDPARGTPQAWIMAIAHRIAIDRLRRRQSLAPTSTTEKAQPTSNGVAQRAAFPAILIHAALTATECEAIHLAYFESLATTDIAAALGLDQNTINMHLHDGLLRATAWLNRSTLT